MYNSPACHTLIASPVKDPGGITEKSPEIALRAFPYFFAFFASMPLKIAMAAMVAI